jgi:glycosyltransferase involved in cell wall biosynthesis
VDELPRWYAFASAFVHPSLLEPWGLVVNEAAACGLPLLVSERAGCVDSLVPPSAPPSGMRFDPRSLDEITVALRWISGIGESERQALGRRAADLVAEWGPDRFAAGAALALDHALSAPPAGPMRRRRVSSLARPH